MSKVFVVQRGHVARTSGAVGTHREQEFVRLVAARIQSLMSEVPGWSLRIINADEPTSRYAGDAFVALHGDGGASSARGASVGYRNAQGRALAAAWKRAYVQAGWPGAFRGDNYTAALRGYYGHGRAVAASNPRAIIAEFGFLTNKADREFMFSEEGLQAAAASVVLAVTGEHVQEPSPVAPPEPEPSVKPTPSNVITVGSKGAAVRSWQRELRRWNPRALPRFGADGDFGDETRVWTVRFMRAVGLIGPTANPAEPQVGPRTRRAMASALRVRFRFAHSALIRRGSKGPAVREWQAALRRWNRNALPQFGADSDFGNETHEWTRRFQRAARIPPDGVVGPQTRGAMEGALNGG